VIASQPIQHIIPYSRMDIMVNELLRQELLAMQAEDRSVRQELVDSGELNSIS
jgi:hypothetical protein